MKRGAPGWAFRGGPEACGIIPLPRIAAIGAKVTVVSSSRLDNLPSYRYPVEDLIKELAEPHAPGACGATAWLLAIAAALVTKAARFTLGREGFEPVLEEMQRVISRATLLGEQCEELIDQDPTAMNRLAAAAALPQGAADEIEIRWTCVQSALKNTAQLPLLVAAHGLEILALAETVVRYGAPGGFAEGTLAVHTTGAAIEGALHAALAVMPSIDDEAFASECREKVLGIRAQARGTVGELGEWTWRRLIDD